jgi:hypothetical protein
LENEVFDDLSFRLPQVASMLNLLGGILFMICGGVRFFDMNQPLIGPICEIVGSCFYVVTSVAMIWMWRDEQYGLVFQSTVYFTPRREADHGRKFTPRSFLFINIYCLFCSVAWINVCMGIDYFIKRPSILYVNGALNQVFVLLLFYTLLLVHSAVVKMPKTQPWRTLIMVARVMAIVLGVNQALSFYLHINRDTGI